MTPAKGVKVRATCHCGQEIDTEAPAGRITWRGPCPKCGRPLIARRVKQTEPTEELPGPEKPPQPGKTIRKVNGYAEGKPRRNSRRTTPVRGDDGTGEGTGSEPQRRPEHPDEPSPTDDTDPEPPPSERRDRPRPEGHYVIPGVF